MAESHFTGAPTARLNHASAAERASYAPAEVWRHALAAPVAEPPPEGELEAHVGDAAVMFADITGFTPLATRLARRGDAGAEELYRLLNDYFGKVLALVAAHGGEPLKFAGDALLVLWPAKGGDLMQATQRAAACAREIQIGLYRYDAGEGTTLSMRVSVAHGTVAAAELRSGDGAYYVVGGPPMTEVAQAQAQAEAGDTVVCKGEWDRLREAAGEASAGDWPWCLDMLETPPLAPTRLPRWTEQALRRIEGYVPAPIRARLAAGHGKWLAELRQVTVLFVQIADLDHAEPGWLQRLDALMCRVQPIIQRYEGFLKEIVVDDKGVGFIVMFGLPPFSHEDDSVRGTRAALELRNAFAAADHAAAFGLATGRCFCGVVGTDLRREYAVIGDAMNIAARLMESATRMPPANRILCDAATRQGCIGGVEFEALEPLRVKGKDQPIAVARPVRVLDRRGERAASTAIVGRALERAAIERAVQQTAHGEQAHTLLVLGEAGIGKSCVIAELAHRAADSGVAAMRGCGDAVESATPYFAWRGAFTAMFGIEGVDDPALRRSAVERWLGERLAPRAPLLGALFALGGGETPETAGIAGPLRASATHDLLIACLERAAAMRPSCVILEDAHWFDPLSWTLVRDASRQVERLLLAVSSRPRIDPVPPELADLGQVPHCTVLALGPLDDEQTLTLARRRLSAAALDPEVEALIRSRAAGHPFLAEELASSLHETGVVVVDEGLCRFAGNVDVEALAFPDTVRGLVTSRIDRLPPREQLVLKVASVIGPAFVVRLLREIHPVHADLSSLESLLEALRNAALTVLIEPEPELSYGFNHVITHEVAYDLMLFAQRRTLHQAAAEWYERAYSEERPELLALLAHHWTRAGVVARAVSYLDKSAVRSFNMGFASASVELGLQAVRLLGVTLPRARADIVPLIGAELQRIQGLLAGRKPAALMDLPRLADENVGATIGMLLRIEPAVHVSGQGELFALIALRCMSLTLEHGNGPEAPLTYSMFSIVYRAITGDALTAFAFSRLSLDLDARHGKRLFSPVAFIHHYFNDHWLNPVEECLEMAANAADAGFASGDLMYACFNNSAHVIYLAYGGRPLSDVMDLARRNYARNGRRVLNAAYHCVLQLQIAKALAGRTRDLATLTDDEYDEERDLASVCRTDLHEEAGWYYAAKLRLHYLAGDFAAALDCVARALPMIQAIAGQPVESEFAVYRALALLARAQELASQPGTERAGLLDDARAVIGQIRTWAAAGPRAFEHRLLLVEGELGATEGRIAAARDALNTAAEIARGLGQIHYEALAHERCAALLDRAGHPAAASVDAAREACMLWGADALVDRLDRRYA
ncbi:AAA family ATPase [Scleromatobacter humisilvae]|uniref:AAA family ATPase n=1 Tax=Scleromatobacter humisilvae TaxID=2897159 RepID=A0A9X2C0R4_9BURK|nr:adenylate/guanylate cyclase domain-containing protein [Scleromatobacter humisilvae]MCK9685009.1 AAA family ATPase [Scleromatobacter humisilvae]